MKKKNSEKWYFWVLVVIMVVVFLYLTKSDYFKVSEWMMIFGKRI